MKEKYLDQALLEYSQSNIYPFHMPGHKRQRLDEWIPESIDITEIEGFDNLHHPEGILKDAQERLARLAGADQSFYLVNGSTAGILAAICGSVKKGDRILIGRNCHKSVYHAIYLMELKVEYVFPEPTEFGIQGTIDPGQIREKIQQFPDIAAVVITSPTYDGIISDIASIAKIVHEANIPLIVDEAHGAHFGFVKGFAQKAIAYGADLCIESFHKTLPCYTQTAVLHLMKSDRVNPERVKRYLGIYQTSSPSYVFMAALDRCVRIIKENRAWFDHFNDHLKTFYDQCQRLKYIDIYPYSSGDEKDNSKILISAQRAGLTGQELYQILLERYQIQMEMASGHYVTAIATVMDPLEGYRRLWSALAIIDEHPKESLQELMTPKEIYQPRQKCLEVAQAMEVEEEDFLQIPLENATGCVSGEFIYLYPPGIPIIAPGEVVDAAALQVLMECKRRGMQIEGMQDLSGNYLRIIPVVTTDGM